MENPAFVSVIVVNYNGKKYLQNCLTSVYLTDYPKDSFEVILVDDNSSDGSIEYAKKNFDGLEVIRNNRNTGPAAAKNIGAKAAKGNLIAFLDNDVEVRKDWLKPLVSAISKDARIGVSCPKILFTDNTKQINSTGGATNIYGDGWDRGVFEEDKEQYDEKREIFYGCSAAMLIKKDIFKKTGYFDSDYFYLYEDLDYGWRLNLAGYRAIYVPESVVYHKFGATMKRDSLIVKYFLERNRLLTLLKNYQTKTLIGIFPEFLKQRVDRVIYRMDNAEKIKFRYVASFSLAWLWNILHVCSTIRKRSRVQSIRKIPDMEILTLMGDYRYKVFKEDAKIGTAPYFSKFLTIRK